MNKRSIMALIVVTFLLFTMVGCAGSSVKSDEEPSFMEQYEDDPAAAGNNAVGAEPTTIRFLFPGYAPSNWEDVKAELEKRTQKKLNVRLDFKWKELMMYMSEVKTLQASNQDYDAFILASPDGYYPDFTKLAREGALKDITNIFPDSAPALFKKYTGEELKYATVDAKLYAVPSLFTKADCASIIIGDELARKYKVKEINDFEQYEAFLKAVKDNEPSQIPGVDAGTFISTLPGIYGYAIADDQNMLVYKWDDPEMKLIAWEKTPEFYDAVNMFIDWYKNGYLKAPASMKDYFTASSVLSVASLTPPSDKAEKMLISSPTGATTETGPVRTFRLYPEKPVQRSNPMGSFGTNGSFVFPKASENTEIVLRFLEWVQLDRNNYNLLLSGIEGEDYIMKNGIPQLPKGMNPISSSYMYWDGNWAFRNIEYETAEKKVDTLKEYLETFSTYAPHGVFYPDYGTLEQVSEKRAKGLQEFMAKLSQGQIKTQEQLDSFIKKMEDLGSDELVTMAQSQLTQK